MLQQLNHFKILEQIGKGGSGTVYKAFDIRLKRHVAIKVIHPNPDFQEEDLHRFLVEARSASSINHPNICTVFDIGQQEDFHFIVMEYLEGETLRQALEKRGAFPKRDVIDIGIKVCSALSAAHEKGIIHRDIKPDNIMLCKDGSIKVMDFSLAKLLGKEKELSLPEDADRSNNISHDYFKTSVTTLQGTASYMSPEQIRKKSVDSRTDIFSLGVVLYQLVSGYLPFKGKTTLDVLESILNETPDIKILTKYLKSRKVIDVLKTALNKLPDQRFQNANEFAKTLIKTKPGYLKKQFKSYFLPFLILIIILLSSIFFTKLFRKSTEITLGSNFTNARTIPLTNWSGLEDEPSFSPNGEKIVFTSDRLGNLDIWMKDLKTGETNNLTENDLSQDRAPKWSPDGNKIAFFSDRGDGGIFIYNTIEKSISQISNRKGSPSWSPDGQKIAFNSSSSRKLYLTESNGKNTNLIYSSDSDDYLSCPSFSANGKWLAFAFGSNRARKIRIQNILEKKGFFICDDTYNNTSPIWNSNQNGIYFRSDRGGMNDIWYQKLSKGEKKPVGDAIPVTFGALIQSMDVSPDCKKIAYSKITIRSNIFAIDLADTSAPKSIRQVTNWNHITVDPSISPDGKRILFASRSQGNLDMWICNRDGSNAKIIYRPKDSCESPAWSPDGKKFVFVDGDAKEMEIKIFDVETKEVTQLTSDKILDLKPAWSPDAKWIVYSKKDPNGAIWIMTSSGKNTRRLTCTPEGDGDVSAKISPDGMWIAYSSNQIGIARNIHIIPFEGGTSIQLTNHKETSGGYGLCWSSDSKFIYYTATINGIRNIWKTSIDGNNQQQVTFYGTPSCAVARSTDICTDGKELFFINYERIGDIWLIENR